MVEQHVQNHNISSNSSASSNSEDTTAPGNSIADFRPQDTSESFTSRLRSTSNSHQPHLDRVHSAKHLDDQSVYHSDNAMTSDEESLDVEKTETIQEVRGGIVNERDVDLEKGRQASAGLEKSKSTRSNRSRQESKLVRDISPPMSF